MNWAVNKAALMHIAVVLFGCRIQSQEGFGRVTKIEPVYT